MEKSRKSGNFIELVVEYVGLPVDTQPRSTSAAAALLVISFDFVFPSLQLLALKSPLVIIAWCI